MTDKLDEIEELAVSTSLITRQKEKNQKRLWVHAVWKKNREAITPRERLVVCSRYLRV